jgi:hypothetical protein
MLAGAPSNWRPAWFETQTASTPSASARAATSGSVTPLRMKDPSQPSRSAAT